jgi:HD superfamily phosphohydrolase YqeK
MITIHFIGADNKRYQHICRVSRLAKTLVDDLHDEGCSVKFVSAGGLQ